jgi:GTP-binding protein
VYDITLALFADAGFIGFPNAGKSSLLNAVTRAQAKVGAYKFTTLDPNLGDFYGFILADIPGLIEGASTGKGLGHKFLRHITRTKLLIHCISLESENIPEDYRTIRKELTAYNTTLSSKRELIVLTKSDMTTSEYISKETKSPIHTVSILDTDSLKSFGDTLIGLLRENK